MKFLLLKEKNKNQRVLLIPNDIKVLTSKGAEIYIEPNYGSSLGYPDHQYVSAGATIKKNYMSDISSYHVICKIGSVCSKILKKLTPTQIVWNYANPINENKYLYQLLKYNTTMVSIKSIQYTKDGSIFKVTEQLKGQLAASIIGFYLSRYQKKGLGKVFGKVEDFNSNLFIIGGSNAAGKSLIKSALALGSNVVVFDYNEADLEKVKDNDDYKQLCKINDCTLSVFKYDYEKLFSMLRQADAVVCAANNPNEPTHTIFNEKMITSINKSAVFVDLASDYGFASQTESKQTKLSKAVFTTADVIHFNVGNVSHYYPKTFSALISKINTELLQEVLKNTFNLETSPVLANAVITYKGKITNATIANSLKLEYTPLKRIVKDQ